MEQFFTNSKQVQEIIRGLNLTKTLFVSSIIVGESHIGKKSLVRYLFPETVVVSGVNQKEVESALEKFDELIITDFEKLANQESLNLDNKRIIATANYTGNKQIIDNLFAFVYAMPSLKERPDDTAHIRDIFIKEAQSSLMIEDKIITIDDKYLNFESNSKTLKKSIYQYVMIQSMDEKNIEQALYYYLFNHLEGNSVYKTYLKLYEKPLIEAGLKKFGSQLQLSQVLGINRNTLRKKIYEHNIN